MGLLHLVVLALFGLAANAQSPKPPADSASQDPLHRDNPQSAVNSFLEASRAHDYARACRYVNLRQVPKDQRLQDCAPLVQQMQQILDRDTQFDVAALSRDPEADHGREHVDTFTVNGKKVDLSLERVPLHSGLSIWQFSPDSLTLVPQIAKQAGSPIEKYLPLPLVSWSLLDTALWRWIALILLAVVLVALSRMLSRLALLIADLLMKRFLPKVDRRALPHFVSPLRLLLCVVLFRAGMVWAGPSARLRLYLEHTLALFFFTAVAWLVIIVADVLIRRLGVRMQQRRQSFSYAVLPMTSRVLKIVILLLTVAAVLSNWGYNTTSLLAGLGVGGLALALAAQKTVENLFGGVSVITDRPVVVGDFCKFGDRSGTVEDIGLRSTRLRTPERTLVSVPNGQFSSMTLENFSQRDKMFFHLVLNLRRDTTPDQVRSLLASITKTLKDHPKVESGAEPVHFVGVGSYSLDLDVSAYILTQDGDEFMRIQQELLLALLDAVQAAGTALALPTQASVSYVVDGGSPGSKSAQAPELAGNGSGVRA
jgi:MscS family membrane protein